MSTLKFQPTQDQLNQLLWCADINPDDLASLVTHIAELSNPPLLPEGLSEEFKKYLKENEAKPLLKELLSFHMLMLRSESKPVEITRAIRDSFGKDDDREKWDTIATHFQSLLSSTPIRLVTKAMDLSYDYANLIQNAKILTDLRPLFDVEGTEVEGGVVTHTLRILYYSDDGSHELTLAMDFLDIKRLLRQCERSITKAETIHDRFVHDMKKPCLISGKTESTDG